MMEYELARSRYRPNLVRVAIVAESPPTHGAGRFFYFENVVTGDSLFLELMKALYEDARGDTRKLRKRKAEYLKRFRDDGFYLLDASREPIAGESRSVKARCIRAGLGQLQRDLTEIRHGKMKFILVSSLVYKICCDPLRRSGLDVVNTGMIDFPGFGRQRAFQVKFGNLIRQYGWSSNSTRGT